MFNLKAFPLDDFSGGITDEAISVQDRRWYARANNFFVTEANKLKVRSGSELDVSVLEARAKIPSNGRVDLLIPGLDPDNPTLLHKVSLGKFYYDDASTTLSELVGPGSASLFPDTTAAPAYALWNDHVLVTGFGSTGTYFRPQKVYPKGDSESAPPLRLRTAGLPALDSTPSLTGGAGSYRYAFCYKYTYTIGDREFIDRGPVTYTASASGGNGASISGIPTLANATGEHWDTATIDVEIYRTKTAATTFYLLATIDNGTTTYSDATADASLSTTVIYTDGGIQDNDPPPKAKYSHVSELGYAYYANCIEPETGQVYNNRVYQSKEDDIDSVPSEFFVDVDDEIVGISSFRGNPVLLGKRNIYRIDGRFDNYGAGGMIAKKIGYIGGINHLSLVQTIYGLFFAGQDGFYWTDGYRLEKVSSRFNTSYLSKITGLSESDQRRVYGAYDSLQQRVWWAYRDGSGSVDNDRCFVLHLAKGIKPDACFTTIGEGDFRATALLFDRGHMFRGHSSGYTFRHSDSVTTDPNVDTAANVADWREETIIYDWRSLYLDFGNPAVRHWTPSFLVKLQSDTEISVQPIVDRDLENTQSECREIKQTSGYYWGISTDLWGDADLWDYNVGLVERRVRVPAQSIRASHRQYRLTNAWTIVAKSDVYGTGVLDTTAKTLTLTNASTVDWPEDVVDYYVAFEDDAYDTEFQVTARTSADVLTFSDTGNLAPANGTYKWVLKGYAKGHQCHILAVIPYSAPISPSQDPFRASEVGGNA